MKMTSLKINGRTVSRLSINGRAVALGSQCDALCFTAKYNQSTLRLSKLGNPDSINLQTSFNGKSWMPYNVGDVITVPNSGGKVYFKAVGQNGRMAISPENYYKFEFTSEFEASGNVNSLLEENEEVARTMSLVNREMCYVNLFSDTNLVTAPELPSTQLAFGCYAFMFHNCALTRAPELPATTLAENCYYNMFSGCVNLKYVKVGFDDWNPQSATGEWLPETYGTFECSYTLISNTSERSTNTVPSSWNMVAV